MNAQQLWLAQATQAPRISIEYVRHRVSSHERGTRLRTVLSYAACVFACGIYGWYAWQVYSGKPLMLAALACYGLFTVYSMYRLHRYLVTQVNPADAGVLDTLRFHRAQLERQRDFRRRTCWQAPAILPGLALQVASMIIDSVSWETIAHLIVVGSLVFTVGIAVGLLRARQSQREIDALDSLAGES
jgi:hypothetical protein